MTTPGILDAFRLDDRVAIVTGSGRGIGAATAVAFAEVGAKVVCVARTRAEIEAKAAEIIDADGDAFAIEADLTAEGEPDRVVEAALAHFGRIDVLVNNAGGTGHVPTKHARDADFDSAIALNFRTPVYLTRACARAMREQGGGSVVNISSGYARAANIGSIPYGGAKAALEQATRMLSMEYAPGIRVNGIRVGAVTTEHMRETFLDPHPELAEKLSAWTPRGRLGEPRDIALAALYLASAASDYVTGRVLAVDGGVVVERSAMEIIGRVEHMEGRTK